MNNAPGGEKIDRIRPKSGEFDRFLKKNIEKESEGKFAKNLGEKNFLGLISKHPSAATI